MKFGIQLHPDEGIDAVMAEARRADDLGFDSIWLWDHLMLHRGDDHLPDRPFDPFTLMTALAAVTKRTRLAWATLNLSFRSPPVLAKMLTTLDHISHGRVIACIGSGWFKDECDAYNIRFPEEHGDRMDYAREVIELWEELWAHPAPERVTYEGKYVQVRDLPFNPAPYQKPRMPIWWGGDSEASVETVKRYCEGWLMISSGNPETLNRVRSAPDWPTRPMTLIKGARVIVHERRDAALAEAEREYEFVRATQPANAPPTFDDFLAREVVGTPDDCLARLAEIESWGINYLRLTFRDQDLEHRVARLLLPRLAEIEGQPLAV